MSEARIPFKLGDLKSIGDRLEENIDRINVSLGPNAIMNFSLEVVPGPGEPTTPAGHKLAQLLRQPSPPRRQRRKTDPDTFSPIDFTLQSIQRFGFTHPNYGPFLMVPKEFQAILARETNAVAQVIWEIMQQTIGWDTGREPGGRREWAPLSVRHFERARILSRSQAERGFKQALGKRYIERRKGGANRYEYRLRWKGTN
jgi:hypothetical protein